MANIGQTVIIRTDLFGDNVGLIAAQVAHIHAQLLYDVVAKRTDLGEKGKANLAEWVIQPYIFVKQVPNLEALEYFEAKAKGAGVATTSWSDTVYVNLSPTQQEAFADVKVGIALGPNDADKIRTVVGDLPLL